MSDVAIVLGLFATVMIVAFIAIYVLPRIEAKRFNAKLDVAWEAQLRGEKELPLVNPYFDL